MVNLNRRENGFDECLNLNMEPPIALFENTYVYATCVIRALSDSVERDDKYNTCWDDLKSNFKPEN